jgi:ATP-dependent helicase/nuclease subunit B
LNVQVQAVGYGEGALDALAVSVVGVKRDDPMAFVTVLAPNSLAGIALRRRLARGVDGRRGVAGLDVTTLPRLAERCAAAVLSPRRPTSRTILSAAIRRALSDEPGPFADVTAHPGTVRALARAYGELREGNGASAEAPLPAAVQEICGRVRDSLRADWYDTVDLLEAAIATQATVDLGRVIVYLPQDLTQAERRFLDAVSTGRDVQVFAGATGVARADAGSVAERPSDSPVTDQNAHASGPAVGGGRVIPTASRVLTASDSDDEVRLVVRDLLGRLGSTPAHRIAVLYSAPVPYARLVHEHLTEAGVVSNGSGVRSVEERAVARVLLDTLALAAADVPRAALFRMLSLAPIQDRTGERVPVSRWERASRAAGVVGGVDWDVRLGAARSDLLERRTAEGSSDEPRPGYFARLDGDLATLDRLAEFAGWLRAGLRAMSTLKSWAELADGAEDLFGALLGGEQDLARLPPAEQYAAAAVGSVLTALRGLDGIAGPADLQTFRDVLDGELSASLPRVGRFGEGVLVAPLSSAIGLDVDLVYVLGLAEDLFPGRSHPDPLLPDETRQLLGLPTGAEVRNRGYRHLLAAFAAPTAVAAFPRGDLRRSTLRLPSRWLLPSLRELSHDNTLAATAWEAGDFGAAVHQAGSYAGELLATALPATGQEWRTRALAAGLTVADPVLESGRALIAGRSGAAFTRYDGNLSHVTGLPDYAVEDLAVAPTTLEGYAKCPHAYFVGRLLHVEPLQQPEDVVTISAADIGTLIHHCLDELVRTGVPLPDFGEPWTSAHHDTLRRIMDDAARRYERRGLTGHPRLWQAERLRIAADLTRMLTADDDWHAERDSKVVASELRFGTGGVAPVEVPVARGRVRLRGSADKVDLGRDGALSVSDLKTGRNDGFKPITQDTPFVQGTKLQLPVYALAARARFGTDTTPVAADYWFVRRTPGRIRLELTGQVEIGFAAVLDTLVGSIAAGLFPAMAPETADFVYVQCPYCNPDGLGHGELRERWEHIRSDPALSDLVSLIDPDAVTA